MKFNSWQITLAAVLFSLPILGGCSKKVDESRTVVVRANTTGDAVSNIRLQDVCYEGIIYVIAERTDARSSSITPKYVYSMNKAMPVVATCEE